MVFLPKCMCKFLSGNYFIGQLVSLHRNLSNLCVGWAKIAHWTICPKVAIQIFYLSFVRWSVGLKLHIGLFVQKLLFRYFI